ncbi:serine/threonine-protein kinase 40 isoform X5 [Nasonia vitripennis]|uniref:Uncharacterized protein n=1 Tax=Nasonia vitripennis TaxID=7425 RepID=A0A7M7PVI9_NASVI|nr:serine/threonine-protein kinase 40 isoform X5 [Nasonia vitripennis]
MLLHSEYSLLSFLQNQDGVHHHRFFKAGLCSGREDHIFWICLYQKNETKTHYVIREKKLSKSLFLF